MPVALPRLWKIKMSPIACMFTHLQLSVTLWTIAHQAPLSMGFSRQEFWSGLPFLTPGDLPDPGIEPKSAESPALAGRFFTMVPPGKPLSNVSWRGKEPNLGGNNPGPALACAASISVSSGEPLVPSGPYPSSGWHCLLIQDDWAPSVLQLWPPPTCAVGEVTISGENLMLSSLGQVCDCQNPLRRESSVLDVFIKPQNHVCDSRKITLSPFHSFHQPLLPTIQDPIIFRCFMTWPQLPSSPPTLMPYIFFLLCKAAASDRIPFPLSWMTNPRFINPNLSLEHLLQEVFQNSPCIYL